MFYTWVNVSVYVCFPSRRNKFCHKLSDEMWNANDDWWTQKWSRLIPLYYYLIFMMYITIVMMLLFASLSMMRTVVPLFVTGVLLSLVAEIKQLATTSGINTRTISIMRETMSERESIYPYEPITRINLSLYISYSGHSGKIFEVVSKPKLAKLKVIFHKSCCIRISCKSICNNQRIKINKNNNFNLAPLVSFRPLFLQHNA